jgi:aminoglycoside 6'-N-acetyltransferase I
MMSRYALEIRAATPIEAPGLATLLADADHVVEPAAISERIASLAQPFGATLVALKWGPPSRLVILHWYRTILAPRPIAQITTLLVATEDRRKGIGRMLIKAAAQAARTAGCGDMEMLVGAGDGTLHAFLQCHRVRTCRLTLRPAAAQACVGIGSGSKIYACATLAADPVGAHSAEPDRRL